MNGMFYVYKVHLVRAYTNLPPLGEVVATQPVGVTLS